MGGMKDVTARLRIRETFLVCSVTGRRLGNDFPLYGNALPSPAAANIPVKTPNRVEFCIRPQFKHARPRRSIFRGLQFFLLLRYSICRGVVGHGGRSIGTTGQRLRLRTAQRPPLARD